MKFIVEIKTKGRPMTVLVFVVYVSVGNSEHKNLHELKTVHYFSITEIIQCSTVVELS